MSSESSVTLYLKQLKAGDQAALQKLWEVYFLRLVGLARKRLGATPRQVADEEDVALSAFASFHRGVDQGRFPRLDDRDDLWHLLVTITSRKALNLARHAYSARQGGGRVRNASAFDNPSEDQGAAFADHIGKEPDPALAAEVAEECRRLLDLLPPHLREVALWKMEGHTNKEIADKAGRSLVSIERRLADIRALWEKAATP